MQYAQILIGEPRESANTRVAEPGVLCREYVSGMLDVARKSVCGRGGHDLKDQNEPRDERNGCGIGKRANTLRKAAHHPVAGCPEPPERNCCSRPALERP